VAHSLSDVLDLNRGLFDQNRGMPYEVIPNLWIQELDIIEEIEKNWKDIHKYFALLLNASGLEEILAEELAILPGMEEVSLLLHINHYVRERKFDVILLDCAPTGESMRFISIPTTLEWYMRKVFKMERAIVKCVRPVVNRLYDVPLPQDDYFTALESLFKRLKGVSEIITDPGMTTVRLVTNPEKIVLKETQRAFMYLCLHRMQVDGIVMNKILPEAVKDPYFEERRQSQQNNMELARNYFNPVPILPVTLQDGEILGVERLKQLAEQVYKGLNPLDKFIDATTFKLFKNNGKYVIILNLPFVRKEEINLIKTGEELLVRVGTMKRIMLLPRQVAAAESVKAELDGSILKLTFGDK